MKKKPNCYSTSKRNTSWNTGKEKEVTEVTISKVATSATKNILNAELSIVEEEVQSMKMSKEMLERYARDFGTVAAFKKLAAKYKKYSFNSFNCQLILK